MEKTTKTRSNYENCIYLDLGFSDFNGGELSEFGKSKRKRGKIPVCFTGFGTFAGGGDYDRSGRLLLVCGGGL